MRFFRYFFVRLQNNQKCEIIQQKFCNKNEKKLIKNSSQIQKNVVLYYYNSTYCAFDKKNAIDIVKFFLHYTAFL